jgi:hypothetical protein
LFFNSFWVFQSEGETDGESEIASMNVPMVFGFSPLIKEIFDTRKTIKNHLFIRETHDTILQLKIIEVLEQRMK